MKTKLFLVAALFVSGCFFADSISANGAPKGNEKQVELKGSLRDGDIRSSGVPFEVFLSEYSISVNFLQDLKGITIEIVNESGKQIYVDVVNPVSGETLPISILGWERGIYTITFSNDAGGCIYGDFEI